MLIVASQGDELYCIFDTVTDTFAGVNLTHEEAEDIVIDHRKYDRKSAIQRVDRCQPFQDIADYIKNLEE